MATIATQSGRIINERECAGKTVAALAVGPDEAGIRFTDGTWFYLEASPDDDSCVIDCRYATPTDGLALDIGLIDRAEYERRQAKQKADAELVDRARYEYLKRKFEPATKPTT
jgi:hypothetical protein